LLKKDSGQAGMTDYESISKAGIYEALYENI
jgi:hypothetical protein